MVWEFIDGQQWCARVAEEMYCGPILDALKTEYPGRRTFKVLEDNDPTGFRSKRGLRAKAECGIEEFEIPKRSPQLNVLDYSVWKEVESRMRRQEKSFAPSFRESRAAFKSRLRRTAKRLPSWFINNSMKNMKVRCERLKAAEGGHFEEGGS